MIVSNARRLRHLVGPLHPHIHLNRIQLRAKSRCPSRSQEFSLNLIVPPSTEVERISFDNETALIGFLRSLNGSLFTTTSAGEKKIISEKRYKALSPLQTYEVYSPLFPQITNVQHYEQISDKGFEDKSRQAMITFMNNAGMAFNEIDRVIKDGANVVAEWEGVFEVDDGKGVYFLECKHRVTAVSTSLSHLC
jgi:hypothetical protein